MTSFPYDESWYSTELLQLWALKSLKYYRKNPPTLLNLFNIPKSLNLQVTIEVLENLWFKEKEKEDPSFFRAFFSTIRKDIYLCTALASLNYMLFLAQIISIYFLADYLSNSTLEIWYGVILSVLFIFASLFLTIMKINLALNALCF